MRVLYPVDPNAELVRELILGVEDALERSYALYSARLYAFLSRLTGHPNVTDDLFQEVWCRLARGRHRLAPDTDLLGWLFTVGRNAYYDEARKKVRALPNAPPPDVVHDDGAPEHAADARRDLQRLEHALQCLTPIDREVLVLIGIDGLEPERAAHVLGISHAALRKRLSRARARLSAKMQDTTPLSETTATRSRWTT